MIEIRWHGRGGQGSFTAARLLGLAAALFENKYALAFPSFGPERRGAPVLGFTKIDSNPITDRSEVVECDYIVVLDDTLLDGQTAKGLKKGGAVLVNTKNSARAKDILRVDRLVALDATTLALEILGRPITNTAMLGALIAISGVVHLISAASAIEHEMAAPLAVKNIALLEKSVESVLQRDI